MNWPKKLLLGLSALALSGCAVAIGEPGNCGIDAACAVESGSYFAKAPEDWEGTTPLPTIVYFHGYGQSGRSVLRNSALMRAAEAAGFLVVAPNGLRRSWSVEGVTSNRRDEIAFVAEVTDAVAARWPVDRSRLWAAGFSLGGSLAWEIACRDGHEFAGFLPVSGAFWRPVPAACPSGPVSMLHVHGRGDRIVPVDGRPGSGGKRRGDVLEGMAFWRGHNQCSGPELQSTGDDGLLCREWQGCSGGERLALCLYDGGHSAPKGWYPRAFRWMRGETPFGG